MAGKATYLNHTLPREEHDCIAESSFDDMMS